MASARLRIRPSTGSSGLIDSLDRNGQIQEDTLEVNEMKVALTGSTGFIGSHVLTELVTNGHSVTALVQGDEQAEAVRARGAEPIVVDLYDGPAVVKVFEDADGAVHTASPGDETSANLDSGVVDAAIDAYGTTGKTFAYISGGWIYGDNTHITDTSPVLAPPMVAWKEPLQQRLLSETGMRGIVVVSSVAYGDGGGAVPGALLGSPRDAAGNLIMIGTGRQHWSTVHVADLASFFRRVLESDSAAWDIRDRRRTESDCCRNHRGGRRRCGRIRGRPRFGGGGSLAIR